MLFYHELQSKLTFSEHKGLFQRLGEYFNIPITCFYHRPFYLYRLFLFHWIYVFGKLNHESTVDDGNPKYLRKWFWKLTLSPAVFISRIYVYAMICTSHSRYIQWMFCGPPKGHQVPPESPADHQPRTTTVNFTDFSQDIAVSASAEYLVYHTQPALKTIFPDL